MARKRTTLNRFDFRGGINTAFAEDMLDKRELRRAQNTRIGLEGPLEKRLGSQNLHTAAIASDAVSLFQWDDPGFAKGEIVQVNAAGNLHEIDPVTGLATILTAGWSPTVPQGYAQNRIGSAVNLYIADDLKGVVEWDGVAETPIATAPSSARGLTIYKGRMFAIDGSKRIFWSAPNDPTLWDLGSDGGFADVETYDAEPIVGFLTIGGSLIVWKRNNIARFSGYDATNIRIDIETEGVSSEVGLYAPLSLVKFEEAAFFVADRGAYIANEGGIQMVSAKIQDLFEDTAPATIKAAVAVHHRERREIWLSVGTQTWAYNYQLGAWSGPWTFSFTAGARFELPDGSESVVIKKAGGSFAVNPDIGTLDDVLFAGTGGTQFTMKVELPVLHFGVPQRRKHLRREQNIEADLGSDGQLAVLWSSEMGNGRSFIGGKGDGILDYRYRGRGTGKRIKFELEETTAYPTVINGLVINAMLGANK